MPQVDDEVVITKEGKYKGDEGHIFDIDEFKGEPFYLVHAYMPHDRPVELRGDEFEVKGEGLTLASEGIVTDGDAFEWIDENISGDFQINTNSEGYTLSIQMKSELHGTVEKPAEFRRGPNYMAGPTHNKVRTVQGRVYKRKKRGKSLTEALSKHFKDLEPNVEKVKESSGQGDKTEEMTAEEFLRKYEPAEDYGNLFIKP